MLAAQNTKLDRITKHMKTVTITNRYWQTMNLEIRIGDRQPPEANPSQNLTLAQGQSQPFTFEVFLYYRRDLNPDAPNGQFTNWTQCFSDDVIDNP